jgi:hypothetical protein
MVFRNPWLLFRGSQPRHNRVVQNPRIYGMLWGSYETLWDWKQGCIFMGTGQSWDCM